MAACTSKLMRAASELAFRDLCISTGRSLQTQKAYQTFDTDRSCTEELSKLSTKDEHNPQQPVVDWRKVFFKQSHALSFNGINDYASLPVGLLNLHLGRHPSETYGFTIDMMVLAHAITAFQPEDVSAKSRKTVMPPAGGMLFSCQDREFGRSRRAARLHSIALLYVGIDGHVHSTLGGLKSFQLVADNQWHRITLTVSFCDTSALNEACLYIDGNLDCYVCGFEFGGLPSYPVLGSGVTEGRPAGASTPVYNCHSFHGLIDELRLWARTLPAYQVKELAFWRIANQHDMPYAHHLIGSWSLTEGRGCTMHEHTKQNDHTPKKLNTNALLGAVAIPSAHHTYSSVSNLVNCIPEKARKSVGPEWVISTAPVEGELIMEFCDHRSG